MMKMKTKTKIQIREETKGLEATSFRKTLRRFGIGKKKNQVYFFILSLVD